MHCGEAARQETDHVRERVRQAEGRRRAAKQSAAKHDDQLAAAGREAEEVVHELAVRSCEKLAEERDHRAG
jgi:hypothetical protein